MTINSLHDIIQKILHERLHEIMRITEFARKTGATTDELRYIEKKGFLFSRRSRLKQREVRQYEDSEIRKIELIIKYRRQGFTWDTAFKKALQELEKPSLL